MIDHRSIEPFSSDRRRKWFFICWLFTNPYWPHQEIALQTPMVESEEQDFSTM